MADELTQPTKTVVKPSKPIRGKLGNLNATRHPWRVFWRRRALKPEQRWVLALVEDYVPQLVADKGGEDAVSYAERHVIEIAATARVCWILAMEGGDHRAVARFLATERDALRAIGLERKAKPLPSLAEILAGPTGNAPVTRASK